MREIYLKPKTFRVSNPIIHFIIRDKRRNCYLGTYYNLSDGKNSGGKNDYNCRSTKLISEKLYKSLLAESKVNYGMATNG
jgi:hypothetical protein